MARAASEVARRRGSTVGEVTRRRGSTAGEDSSLEEGIDRDTGASPVNILAKGSLTVVCFPVSFG
jgi:hypothetical protein